MGKFMALPTFIMTKLFFSFLKLPNHPWRNPATGKFDMSLAEWRRGQTKDCQHIDYGLWYSLVVVGYAAYTHFNK